MSPQTSGEDPSAIFLAEKGPQTHGDPTILMFCHLLTKICNQNLKKIRFDNNFQNTNGLRVGGILLGKRELSCYSLNQIAKKSCAF